MTTALGMATARDAVPRSLYELLYALDQPICGRNLNQIEIFTIIS